ncbi:P4H11 [Symbiodinium natans]|uniref:P4H11 protein n=1 Tax=Symbiodinium natans TaxID=878477 RepID=A0A812S0P8_9DINO|nr:P4H11 [Symbiodinium natans]
MGKLGIRKKVANRGPKRPSAVDQAKAAKDAGRCDEALELLKAALPGRGAQVEVAKYELALLLSQLGRHEEADHWLRQLGLTWKLNPSVLDGSCLTGPTCRGDANFVAAFDDALPRELLQLLQDAFQAGSAFWKEHKYPTPNFFSYNEKLQPGGAAAEGAPLIRMAASHVKSLAVASFPAIFGCSGCDRKVSSVEWWAHTRPAGSGSGHQLHYDLDEVSLPSLKEGSLPHHPLVSCVLYLSCGSAATASTTLVTDQTLKPGSRASRGWLCEPRVNRVLLFDGSLLHGVIPNLALQATDPSEPRVTLMLGLWGEQGPCGSPAPSPTQPLGPNMQLPREAAWPELLRPYVADAKALQAPSAATPADLAGPVQPVWCSTETSEDSASSPGSVEFIGRWFLSHAPEELQRVGGTAQIEVEAQNARRPSIDPDTRAPTGLRSLVVSEERQPQHVVSSLLIGMGIALKQGSMNQRCLLAAHFAATDVSRVDRLRRLLRSVEEQTLSVPLLVSWSAEDAEADKAFRESVAERASAVIDDFQSRGVIHAMPRLRGRRAQFQHYARLRESLKRHIQPSDQPWVFFSDDDDLWHPRRAQEYVHAIQDRPDDVPVVHSRVHLSPGLGPRLPLDATATEVTRMEADGLLRLAISAEEEEPGLFGTATGEYFDAAAKFEVFDEFFDRHNDQVIANKFADIRFRTHLLRGGASRVYRFLPSGGTAQSPEHDHLPWMYFYDRPTMPYSTPPGEEDLEYVSEELPDPKRIAGLRQTLDCVLFQLAPTAGPLEITEQDFAQRLVGTLNEVTPANAARVQSELPKHLCERGRASDAFSELREALASLAQVGKYSDAKAETVESDPNFQLLSLARATLKVPLHRSRLAKLPIETLERLVVLRYELRQAKSSPFTMSDGKFRPITVFLYLNELPDAAGAGVSCCAVMWPNAQADGTEAPARSLLEKLAAKPRNLQRYGVNCFFHVQTKRLVRQLACYVVSITDLEEGKKDSGEEPAPVETPQLVTVCVRLEAAGSEELSISSLVVPGLPRAMADNGGYPSMQGRPPAQTAYPCFATIHRLSRRFDALFQRQLVKDLPLQLSGRFCSALEDPVRYGGSSEVLVVGDAEPGEWIFNVLTGKCLGWSSSIVSRRIKLTTFQDKTLRDSERAPCCSENLSDSENNLFSPGVTDLAIEKGWWHPKEAKFPGDFDFFGAYGYEPTAACPLTAQLEKFHLKVPRVQGVAVGISGMFGVMLVGSSGAKLDPNLGNLPKTKPLSFKGASNNPLRLALNKRRENGIADFDWRITCFVRNPYPPSVPAPHGSVTRSMATGTKDVGQGRVVGQKCLKSSPRAVVRWLQQMSEVMNVFRDHYEGTPYDLTKDRSIRHVDDFQPESWGLDLPEPLIREMYIVRSDLTPVMGWETGRRSEPAFMDMNLHAIRGKSEPQVVLYQYDESDPMNPRGLLIAYAEAHVKPVVSDFDTFTVGSRGMRYSQLPADQALAQKEAKLITWLLQRTTEILGSLDHNPWTSRWLEVLKKENEKEDGVHPELPKFGFGDPTS